MSMLEETGMAMLVDRGQLSALLRNGRREGASRLQFVSSYHRMFSNLELFERLLRPCNKTHFLVKKAKATLNTM